MKIAFISNYLNHHQYPFCRELMKQEEVEFRFVATMPIRKERLELGYRDMNQEAFVVRTYESSDCERTAETICKDSDIVIIGSAPEKYVRIRIRENKLLFRYSERIFKNGIESSDFLKIRLNMWMKHGRFSKKKVYLLSAGTYAAFDFNRMGAYKGKSYKWGYFPETENIECIEKLCDEKEPGSILWVGRYLDWKHPEIPVEIGKRLAQDKIPFHIKMIGTGNLFEKIKEKIESEKLNDYIEQTGAMSPECVREYMKKSEILIFSSDFHEGWGAVLNEAMNSGCAVAASHAIGSASFLIEDGENGMIYQNGNTEELYELIYRLLVDDSLRRQIQKKAYGTIVKEWNPQTAASRFCVLARTLLKEEECEIYEQGPCSRC